MKRMCLSLIGDICFPEEFKQIFTLDGKFLITRSLGSDWCFEMSGESMFYALCEIEKSQKESLFDYKLSIIEAIDRRIIWGNGKLLHRSFTGDYDIQFRSTNSALRTLLYACEDGFDTDKKKEKSFGLIGMRERVDMFKGEFSVTSQKGQGTRVFVKLPFSKETTDSDMNSLPKID